MHRVSYSNQSTPCYSDVFKRVRCLKKKHLHFSHAHNTNSATQDVSVTDQIVLDFTVIIPVSNIESKQSHSCNHEIQVHLWVVSASKKGKTALGSSEDCWQNTAWKERYITTNFFLKKIKSNRKLVIVNTTRQFLIILPLKRDLWMCCVQIKTALGGRHCILKQGHDVFITLSRSIHVILTQPHEVCCQLCRKVIAHSLLPKIQFTHYRGYQPSIMNLIKKTSVRSELEVVIWSRSVVLETTSTVKWE